MPRKSTNTKKSIAQNDAAAAAPVADVVAVAPVAVAAPVADVVVADAADVPEVEGSCADAMDALITDLENLAKVTRGFANKMKKVKKAHDKEMKAAAKASKSGKKSKRPRDPDAPKRAPSGFNKAAPLSGDLCKFLGLPVKAELSRPAVTKQITKYIKDNNLQNPTNKREIVPDKKLSKLLSGPTDAKEALTFFNLQKYIKHHFPKSDKPAVPVATVTA
jgi:chromatin remodeling complex protein RSC6